MTGAPQEPCCLRAWKAKDRAPRLSPCTRGASPAGARPSAPSLCSARPRGRVCPALPPTELKSSPGQGCQSTRILGEGEGVRRRPATPGQLQFWWGAPWLGLAGLLSCSHAGTAPRMLGFRACLSGLLGPWTIASPRAPGAHPCHVVPGSGRRGEGRAGAAAGSGGVGAPGRRRQRGSASRGMCPDPDTAHPWESQDMPTPRDGSTGRGTP